MMSAALTIDRASRSIFDTTSPSPCPDAKSCNTSRSFLIDVLAAGAFIGEVLNVPPPPVGFGVDGRPLRVKSIASFGLFFGAYAAVGKHQRPGLRGV
jgi:hypothetical protein